MKLRIILPLCILSLFPLLSCDNTNKDPYKDNIIKESTKLTTTGNIITEYDVSSTSQAININDLKVYYPNSATELKYFDKDDDDITQDGGYFITTSNSAPTINRVKPSGKMSTNKSSYSLTVYVATIDKNENSVYISKGITITLKNSKALNPILYWVGGGALIIVCVGLVYFAKKYKEKHP